MEWTRDLHEPRRLSVCPLCGVDFVVPIDGAESQDHWTIDLRCGACGVRRTLFASDEEVDALCDDIDAGMAKLAAEADRLNRERREAEIQIFTAALTRDLISGDDFAR